MMKMGLSKVLESVRRPLGLILISGLAIRLILMPILTCEVDLAYWMRITGTLDAGFTLYDTLGYYYTPIWGYIVAVFSGLGDLLGFADIGTFVSDIISTRSTSYDRSEYVVSIAYAVIMKLPLVITDTVVAFLLYDMVRSVTGDPRKATFAFGLWYLCPFVIAISSIHGMFDNISTMLLVLTVSLVMRRRYFLGGVSFGLAVMTKMFPVFFMFFLIAYVLRKEGTTEGFKQVAVAFVGSVLAFVAVELPMILRGEFWDSFFFFTDRIGVSTETMEGIFGVRTMVLIGVAIVVVCLSAYCVRRFLRPRLWERFIAADPVIRDRRVKVCLAAFGTLVTVVIVAFSTFIGSKAGMPLGDAILNTNSTVLMFAYSFILELYLAYRLLTSDTFDDRTVFTTLFLSSVLIFLWPPTPQYLIVTIPFMVTYVVIVNNNFLRPFMTFTLFLFAYEMIVNNFSLLFTMSVYTDLIPLELPLRFVELMITPILGIPFIDLLVPILSILYMLVLVHLIVSYRGDGKEVAV